MKTLFVLVAILLTTVVFSQDEPKEPEALVKAREVYQKEVKRVTEPIIKDYLAKLDALKKELGGKGDAEGAMAVQKEIGALKEAQADPTEPKKDWIEGTWQYSAEGGTWYRDFKNGKCRVRREGRVAWEGTYIVISPKKVVTSGGGSDQDNILRSDGKLDIAGVFRAKRVKDNLNGSNWP
jgi:hypothetical protein